ncbi:MAG: endonuclease domain-containing protein [Kouleothrix sp.]|nr:endonuclease domain-containing protein [Kouleothrix sp.]
MPIDRERNNAPRRLPALNDQARQHRAHPTVAEARLWQHLRDRRLGGFKFRRQHAIDRFIVDFCCVERRLIVELDGSVHAQQVERDRECTTVLEGFGYRVLRFRNDQVEDDIGGVIEAIRVILLAA